MVTSAIAPDELSAAKAGAAAYSLMAHGFRYPDGAWLATLTDPERWQDWTCQLSETHHEAMAPLEALRLAIEGLNTSSGLEQLQEQFALLFGHSVRGTCPPYELEFGKSEVIQRASDLADISGFYAAFGMELTGDVSERADHFSVESEFLAVLSAKAACAIESHDQEHLATVLDAQRAFLKSHLGRWFPAFSRRVMEFNPGSFYGRLADFTNAFLTSECKRFDVSLGSVYLQLRQVDPVQEATQSCGVPGECGSTGDAQLTQLHVAGNNEG